jgi:hypothetical protein
LLQLLDEGMLTDGLGQKVNFKMRYHHIGVKEVASFGKTWGLNQSLRHLKRIIKHV